MKRISAAVVSFVLITACGGDDKGSDATTAPTDAPTTEPSTTDPSTTDPSTTDPSTTDPSTTTAAVVAENSNPELVDLSHFEIKVDSTVYKAGAITFLASNSDDVPHEFGITRGNSYEELPLLANGSIDEDALGADLLGKTPVVDQVLSPTREITFDLAPGNYVMFCNIVAGASVHAARGQVLSITVVP